MDEPYRVEVLHIVNPHLIFVESQIKGEPVIQQVGIYGVLPVYKTIDIDGEIIAERCENWPVAANTLLREFLAEHKNHVYFVPIHVDDRSTIFDENIHQFGDIIIQHRTTKSITDHLLELVVAVKDEPTFHQKLASGNLKLKLNTTRTEEVLKAIEKYYKRQRKVDHDWQKTLKKQTSLHQETKKITALTEENLKLLERSSQVEDAKDVIKTFEQKEKDLNLCKDADLISVGCGSRRNRSLPTSANLKVGEDDDYKPHEMFTSLKQYLVTHGGKKDAASEKHGKLTNIKINDSLDSDSEWDYVDDIPNSNNSGELDKNDQFHQKYYSEEQQQKNHKLKQSTQGEENYANQYYNEKHEMSQKKVISNKSRNTDQNVVPTHQCESKQGSYSIEKSHKQRKNLSKYDDVKGMHVTSNKVMRHLKPKERRLVYCPDMELNSTNLKNLVTITINENSAANYANTVEVVPGIKTETVLDDKNSIVDKNIANDVDAFHNVNTVVCKKTAKHVNSTHENVRFDVYKKNATDIDNFDDDVDYDISKKNTDDVTIYHNVDSNVCDKSAKDTISNKTDSQSNSNIKATGKVNSVKGRLNISVLERKLRGLKNFKENDDNVISSNSDVSCHEKASLETKSKINELETDTHTVSHNENTNPKSDSSKTNQTLSSSILQKKLQALKDLKKRKERIVHSSSTSDTSVKDTNSSTEQSKIDTDELDQTIILPEPINLEPQPKLAENISKVVRNVNPFKNLDGSKSVFVEKLVTPILMVHTKNNNLILPQCELRDIPFKPDIRMMLKSMRIQKPKRLQTVTWSYILRGHSLFIIGPAGNGKTIGYVPAVCNLVVDSLIKSEGVGPVSIIVCATALSVSEIESHCKRFLGVEERVVTCFPGIEPTETTTALLNGCHVLICTAPALVNLLETDFGVDLRRLTTLVLDDCERLSQVYTAELAKIINNVKVMLKNRADKALKVQYIVVSRQWCDFMTPLAQKATDTVITIGASQECVLYSKTKTSVTYVKDQAKKVNRVVEFLEEIDRTKRTVIVCREDEEVIFLENTLTSQKHVVFACNSTMDLHDLCRLNEAWANYEEPVLGPILVCCDGNLIHLNITNANYLVHFSMPPLFSMFCKRFSVLNENYASIFGPEKDDVKIKILLDETNVEQLPKILHFVKRCTKEAFPNLNNVLQEVLEAKDLKKAVNLNPVCNNLLMLGKCADTWNCSDRHTMFKEYDEPKEWIPRHGLITFKITHYDSAVTYSARVLSNITKTGPVKYPNNYNTLSFKMGMYYSKEINRRLHGVPKLGDVCAVALKQNFFERCRVMKVIPSDTKNINHVLINLIDEEQMTVVSDVLLYYLPDDLKAIETHVVKVRLANIQPKDRDVTFSLAAKDHLQKITDREREHGLYIRGQVVMTLGNTIFVDTAEACVDLSSLGETVVKRDFKKELLDRHAEPNPQHIEKLKKISGVVDSVDINEPKVTSKEEKCPKWAHLDKDDFSTVILAAVVDAGTVFLRHAKFQKVLDSLLKDIKEYIEKAPEIDLEEKFVGNIILAEFPDDGTYERARIDEIVNDKMVKCFFVDNGDWRQVAVEKLKPITDNIMNRIPFQAIECRLVGVRPPGDAGAWPDFSTCWLDDNCFEDKDGNQKQLYAKYFTKEKATLTGGHKYGVLLFDTYTEDDLVINKMMIELNLAKVIEEEQKYIDEPLDIKRVKVSDSSSDVSDEDVTKEDSSGVDQKEPVIKDLVPLQTKESENIESNDIPLHSLLGKPIRSVPLVDSDNESDISDKWDVNVDKDLLGMFGQPSKANIVEEKDTKVRVNDILLENKVNITEQKDLKIENILTEKTEVNDTLKIRKENLELDVSNKNKEPYVQCVTNSCLNRDDNEHEEQSMSPSLDSDDIDVSDEKVKALDIFRRKISKGDVTENVVNNTNPKSDVNKNNTLDSDDLSSVATETSAKVIDPIEPPRKPKIVWRQNKGTVAMKINLIGVEEYVMEIRERYVKFHTWHNDIRYEFEFELYGVIVPEKCVHSNKGQYIQVSLVKMLPRNWLSLTRDFSSKKWIVYDVDAIELASDKEENNDEEARKVIKHNHEKVESSSEDDFADDMDFKYKRH